jgi:hypothetical protein
MVEQREPPMGWTLATLQRVMYLGSVRGGSGKGFLSNLSSIALCNLLVLLELNTKTLCEDVLGPFLRNVEELGSVKRDEWCKFLIRRLRERTNVSAQESCDPRVEGKDLLAWAEEDALDAVTVGTETGEENDSNDSSSLSSPLPLPDSANKPGASSYTCIELPSHIGSVWG